MGSNPGLRGGWPATDHISYGKAVTRPTRTAAQQIWRVYTEHTDTVCWHLEG
jgi:hypothetical protein